MHAYMVGGGLRALDSFDMVTYKCLDDLHTYADYIYIHMRIAVEGCEHNQPIAMPGKVMLHVLVLEEELVVAEGRPRELAGRGDGA